MSVMNKLIQKNESFDAYMQRTNKFLFDKYKGDPNRDFKWVFNRAFQSEDIYAFVLRSNNIETITNMLIHLRDDDYLILIEDNDSRPEIKNLVKEFYKKRGI